MRFKAWPEGSLLALLLAAACVFSAPGAVAGPPATGTVAAELTPDLIKQAIKEGQKKPSRGFLGLNAAIPGHYPMGGSKVEPACWLSTPYGRVVFASYQAFTEYKTFGPTDVTPEMTAPELVVSCDARTMKRRDPDGVRAVVLTRVGDRTPTPPLRTETSDGEYQNSYGATFKAKKITNVYPLDAFTRDRELHVVYESGDDVKVSVHLGSVQ